MLPSYEAEVGRVLRTLVELRFVSSEVVVLENSATFLSFLFNWNRLLLALTQSPVVLTTLDLFIE